MFNKIVVVEGLHDKQKIESVVPGAECIVTNGTEISEATIKLIKTAAETRGIILMLDPDHPGRSITGRLLEIVPNAGVAFLARKEAISPNGRKVGVEHADATSILNALEGFRTIDQSQKRLVSIADLASRGLVGRDGASARRAAVAERLSLPPSNAKTLLKWLNMLGISPERLDG